MENKKGTLSLAESMELTMDKSNLSVVGDIGEVIIDAAMDDGIFKDIPVIGAIVVLIGVLLISYLLMIVWYLFVANPEYPTEYYLKGSVKYMGDNLLAYIGFAISVAFVPVLIEMVVSMFVGSAVAGVLCIPFDAYINLAVAGYVSQIIPDAWFNGTEIF